MRGALDVHRELLARDVPHEMVRLAGRALSGDDLPRLLDLPVGCVTVRCYELTRDGGRSGFAAVLVPAGKVPDPASLLEALGARSVRAASADVVNEVTDYVAGLVAPVCLPESVELIADSALGDSDVCYCPAGEGQVALGIRTRDLLVATGARVATLTAPEPDDDAIALELDSWTAAHLNR